MHGFEDIKKEELDSLPTKIKKYDPNPWADHIELLCLRDDIVSKTDIGDLWYDVDLDNSAQKGEESHLKRSVDIESEIDDYFMLLKYRADTCGLFYPFTVKDKKILQIKSRLTRANYVYIYLLLCSSISLMEKSVSTFYEDNFEVFCSYAFSGLVSKNSSIELFGPKNKSGIFRGTLADRIEQLGKMIGLDSLVTGSVKYNSIPGGDGGIDIISVNKLDGAENVPFAFGQVTCSYNDWQDKQNDASHSTWSHRLNHLVNYPEYMFIPFSFHNSSDKLCEPSDIKTFLVDRIRLIKLVMNNEDVKSKIVKHCYKAFHDN